MQPAPTATPSRSTRPAARRRECTPRRARCAAVSERTTRTTESSGAPRAGTGGADGTRGGSRSPAPEARRRRCAHRTDRHRASGRRRSTRAGHDVRSARANARPTRRRGPHAEPSCRRPQDAPDPHAASASSARPTTTRQTRPTPVPTSAVTAPGSTKPRTRGSRAAPRRRRPPTAGPAPTAIGPRPPRRGGAAATRRGRRWRRRRDLPVCGHGQRARRGPHARRVVVGRPPASASASGSPSCVRGAPAGGRAPPPAPCGERSTARGDRAPAAELGRDLLERTGERDHEATLALRAGDEEQRPVPRATRGPTARTPGQARRRARRPARRSRRCTRLDGLFGLAVDVGVEQRLRDRGPHASGSRHCPRPGCGRRRSAADARRAAVTKPAHASGPATREHEGQHENQPVLEWRQLRVGARSAGWPRCRAERRRAEREQTAARRTDLPRERCASTTSAIAPTRRCLPAPRATCTTASMSPPTGRARPRAADPSRRAARGSRAGRARRPRRWRGWCDIEPS